MDAGLFASGEHCPLCQATGVALWLDAKQEKVRDRGHVVSNALVIAYGVHEAGRREVIGLDVGEIEAEAFWREFLRSLRRRGLEGVRPVRLR